MNALIDDIRQYWTTRASGYNSVNQQELAAGQDEIWLNEIKAHIPERNDLTILDIGCGPGFFTKLLAEQGYLVTAIDCTQEMLNTARINAGQLSESIDFRQMDAQKLDFADETFDVVISRNLTWNLEHPDQAYREWLRVLKPGGVLLNFDANWYGYLYRKDLKQAYEADRKRTEQMEVEDYYDGTDIDAMERIARQVPLSSIKRPGWDEEILTEYGASEIHSDPDVWKRVWMDVEKINCASTPMFLVWGRK